MSEPGRTGQSGRSGSIAGFLLRGGGLTLMARLLAIAAGLAVQMLLARLLEPESVGAYFLTQSVVAFVALIGQLGLPRILVRELARATGAGRPEKVRGLLFGAARIAGLGVGAIALLYLLGIGPWLATSVFNSPAMLATTGIATAWMVGIAVQSLGSEALRGLHRLGAASLLGGAFPSLLTVVALVVLLATRGRSSLAEVILLGVLASALTFAVMALVIRQQLPGSRQSERISTRWLLAGTFSMLIANVSSTGVAQSDLWIVGALLPESDVALYGAAKRLIRLVSMPMVVVTMIVPPVIADLYYRGERERLQRALQGVATLSGIPAVAALLVFMLGSGLILRLVYGEFYEAGAFVLAVLSVERILYVWAGPSGITLMMTGHERTMMVVTLITGAVEVATTYAGAALAGNEGAAIGFLIGSGLRSLLTWNEVRRTTGIVTHVNLFRLRESIEPVRRALSRRAADR